MGFNWNELDRYELEQEAERKRRPSRETILLEKKKKEKAEAIKTIYNSYLLCVFYMLLLANACGFFSGGFTWPNFLLSLATGAGIGILLFFRRHKASRVSGADETPEEADTPETPVEEYRQDRSRTF